MDGTVFLPIGRGGRIWHASVQELTPDGANRNMRLFRITIGNPPVSFGEIIDVDLDTGEIIVEPLPSGSSGNPRAEDVVAAIRLVNDAVQIKDATLRKTTIRTVGVFLGEKSNAEILSAHRSIVAIFEK